MGNTSNAPAASATPPAAETKKEKAPELVTVVANEPIREAGEFYDKGKEFETTPERAKALGTVVTLVS